MVLGACMGEALLGKKLGKRAMLLGALAQSIPDIDFISALWNDTASNLLAHRGFTHSLLFGLIAMVFFALLAEHFHRTHRIGWNRWLLFFGLQIGAHLFLDLFNSYGMGLLEPFSHVRLSFNALFVADPVFSLGSATAAAALLILRARIRRRIFWWRFGLLWSAVYMLYCTMNKIKIDADVREILVKQQIHHPRYFTTPTAFNNWLWYVVARSDSGFYIGYRSVFDKRKDIRFHYFPQDRQLLASLAGHEELQHLVRFSQGYYTVEKWNDTLVFNDLRFGQIMGWQDPEAHFVFHYFLQKPWKENRLVVQRGRFAGWNRQTARSLLHRIGGN